MGPKGEAMERMEEQDRQTRVQWVLPMVSAGDADSLAGTWDDPFKQKQKHLVRVYLQNIRGLLTNKDDDVKYTHLQQFITMNHLYHHPTRMQHKLGGDEVQTTTTGMH